jgi:hypothetical protein
MNEGDPSWVTSGELEEEQADFGGRRFLGIASSDEEPLSERKHVSRGQVKRAVEAA